MSLYTDEVVLGQFGGYVSAPTNLITYEIPPLTTSLSTPVTAGTAVSNIQVTGSQITLNGAVNGLSSSSGWRFYTSSTATDLTGAMTAGTYFSWNITAPKDLRITAINNMVFSRGNSAPSNLALLYSPSDLWTGSSYRTISNGVAIQTSQTDLASAISGDLSSNPINISSSLTGYFRLYYWGATSNTSGAIWVTNSSPDMAFVGYSSSSQTSGKFWSAIQALNDTKFSSLTNTLISGDSISNSNPAYAVSIPAGVVLYGKFSDFMLHSGAVIAYNGGA